MKDHEGFTTSFTGAVAVEVIVVIAVFIVAAILVNIGVFV